MKILHTADWHIGKVLHKHPLQDELKLFFDWLLNTINSEQIDLLLISGDIFDFANPSAQDRELYYSFLRKLIQYKIKIIITGGNHDSVGFINAPKNLLQELNISIIGGATDNLEDELIPIKNALGEIELVVAAVPFLRDKDLRHRNTDQEYSNRTEAIRAGIQNHYHQLSDLCEKRYPEVPTIAMGHLYAVGAQTSESERDIHLGNAASVDVGIFSSHFQYVALGHIHRPQLVGGNEFIRYSGSPIALSFSEKRDNKIVLILELKDGQILNPTIKRIPKFRELKSIQGSLSDVRQELSTYQPDFPLISFVELKILEENFSPVILAQVEDLKQSYQDHTTFKVLKGTTDFNQGTKDTSDLFIEGESIEDLKPQEIFAQRLSLEQYDAKQIESLSKTFQELLEMVQQAEQ